MSSIFANALFSVPLRMMSKAPIHQHGVSHQKEELPFMDTFVISGVHRFRMINQAPFRRSAQAHSLHGLSCTHRQSSQLGRDCNRTRTMWTGCTR